MISVAPDHNRKTPDGRGRVKPLVIAATILVAIAALYWTQALLIPFALAVLLTLKTSFNAEEIYKISKLSLYTVVVGANQKDQ
jgi:ABC-type nitrate/sulfonate/bicarbonate transport system permease component